MTVYNIHRVERTLQPEIVLAVKQGCQSRSKLIKVKQTKTLF